MVCVGDSSKISFLSISMALFARWCGMYHATATTGTRPIIRRGFAKADDSNSGVCTEYRRNPKQTDKSVTKECCLKSGSVHVNGSLRKRIKTIFVNKTDQVATSSV